MALLNRTFSLSDSLQRLKYRIYDFRYTFRYVARNDLYLCDDPQHKVEAWRILQAAVLSEVLACRCRGDDRKGRGLKGERIERGEDWVEGVSEGDRIVDADRDCEREVEG